MVIKEHQQKWVIDRLDLEHNHDLRPADSNNLFSEPQQHTYSKDDCYIVLSERMYDSIAIQKKM